MQTDDELIRIIGMLVGWWAGLLLLRDEDQYFIAVNPGV